MTCSNILPICEPWCWYIYLHDWVIIRANVGKYSIHGAYRAIVENTWGPHVFEVLQWVAVRRCPSRCPAEIVESDCRLLDPAGFSLSNLWSCDSSILFHAPIFEICVSFLCSKRWTGGNFQIWYSYPSLPVAGIIIVMVAVIPISTYVDLQWNPAAHNMTLYLCSHATSCGW